MYLFFFLSVVSPSRFDLSFFSFISIISLPLFLSAPTTG